MHVKDLLRDAKEKGYDDFLDYLMDHPLDVPNPTRFTREELHERKPRKTSLVEVAREQGYDSFIAYLRDHPLQVDDPTPLTRDEIYDRNDYCRVSHDLIDWSNLQDWTNLIYQFRLDATLQRIGVNNELNEICKSIRFALR
jgi:hypothetical protein